VDEPRVWSHVSKQTGPRLLIWNDTIALQPSADRSKEYPE
jgi:hypothetical protein